MKNILSKIVTKTVISIIVIKPMDAMKRITFSYVWILECISFLMDIKYVIIQLKKPMKCYFGINAINYVHLDVDH
jgi:hypothetical protein